MRMKELIMEKMREKKKKEMGNEQKGVAFNPCAMARLRVVE
jgi:hypothetical protein